MLDRVIFCHSDSFLSSLIRLITGQNSSHVALRFGPFVIHSRLMGVEVSHWRSFEKKYCIDAELVHQGFPIKIDIDQVVESYDGLPYDFGGLVYLGLYYFVRNRLGFEIPGGNFWASKNHYMCTEFASQVLESKQESMVSPGDLEQLLLKKGFEYIDPSTDDLWNKNLPQKES